MSQYKDVIHSQGKETEDFLSLLVPVQGKIYGYILSQWPNRADAEDIMQETVTTIWKKFHSYESGTNFLAWAITIARFTVMSFRRNNARRTIQFNEEALRVFESRSHSFLTQYDGRLEMLSECVQKLNKQDRNLLEMKYIKELPAKRMASCFNISPRAIYKNLSRIHHVLMRCVNLSLAEETIDGP